MNEWTETPIFHVTLTEQPKQTGDRMNRIYRMDSIPGRQARWVRFNESSNFLHPAHPVHPVENFRLSIKS
jgi:hypothetical protein